MLGFASCTIYSGQWKSTQGDQTVEEDNSINQDLGGKRRTPEESRLFLKVFQCLPRTKRISLPQKMGGFSLLPKSWQLQSQHGPSSSENQCSVRKEWAATAMSRMILFICRQPRSSRKKKTAWMCFAEDLFGILGISQNIKGGL